MPMMKKPSAGAPSGAKQGVKSRRPRAPKPDAKAPEAPVPSAAPAPSPAVLGTVKAPQPVIAPQAPAPEAPLTDAELALLALYAEDAFQMARRRSGADLTWVAPDPRLAPRWRVVGTLTAVDALIRIGRHKIGARRVFYGWLLRSRGGRLALAIRGTATRVEWAIDCMFAPRTAHPMAGRVESGFWDVYASMQLDGRPLTSIAKDAGEPITVVGHSLGAALATYASFELAKAGATVRGVFVASPRPGDKAFSEAFGAAVPDHMMYRNAADLVPRVPFWFGYSDVPKVTVLSPSKAGITITGGPAGQHHVLSYVALMDRRSLKSFKPLPIDQQFLDCVHL